MTVSQPEQSEAPRPSPRPRPEPETSAGTPEPPDDSGGSGTREGGRGPKPLLVTLAVTLVMLLAAAVTFGVLWFLERSAAAERDDALAAAEVYAIDLTTYNYGRIDENFERVQANSTEKFAETYGDVSEQLSDLLKEHKADSQGEVLTAGVAEFDGNKAVVLVFVDQTITNTNSPQPKIDRNRMVLTLLDVDGEWKLDEVALT
ncbi:MAG: VirB8/TrbF family protein [Haloechinothrix sp.]